MQVDFVIVGQGISGTFLSYHLFKEKQSFIVVDNNEFNAPSRIAAGIINPVTGRRMVTVWMADEILPFAWNAYGEIGKELNVTAISQKNIIDFFPNPFMRENFLKRVNEGNEYTQLTGGSILSDYFNYEFGYGEIKPVYIAHLETLLPAWRKKLADDGLLLDEVFDATRLVDSGSGLQWTTTGGRTIVAKKIIFCDGTGGLHNPYFSQLPFAANKGEALIVEINGLPNNNTYKKDLLLAPFQKEKNLFWAGTNYLWDFENADPTPGFRNSTERSLRNWLKLPFRIVDHLAGIRPATVERRPFVGMHPRKKNIGILNGMGTKGCSLAPFFARQLASHLLHGHPITAEADVSRFQGILSRTEF